MAPRLVAPHPNTGRSRPLKPEQAVALLAQARLREFQEFAKTFDEVPTLEDAVSSSDWSWRFAGVFGNRLITGNLDELRLMIDDAPTSAALVATTVVVASGLLEEGQADDALSLLEAVRARDDAEPVDNAWLAVQFARACVEIGRVQEARRVAYDVQQIRQTHAQDVTATAIAGVAATLLFDTAAWGDEDLAGLITGMDNAVAWWRTQTVSRGLVALANRTYKNWSHDSSIILGGEEKVNNQLAAASLTASHLGDNGDWRHLASIRSRASLVRLTRDADVDVISQLLGSLRLAGDQENLKLAIKRIRGDGPAAAITETAADLDLEISTRTTGRTNLTLLQYGGDLLDAETAESALRWLLRTFKDPSAFGARTTPSYDLTTRLLDTIASVIPASSSTAQRLVVDHLATLEAQEDQAVATSWTRVVDALPASIWTPEVVAAIGGRAEDHHWSLRFPLLGLMSKYDSSVKDRLVQEACDGSSEALSALGRAQELSAEVAASLIAGRVSLVDQQIREAHSGQFGFGGADHGRTLAVLNIWHPGVADWEPLFRLLEDPMVVGDHKRGALRVLTASVDHLSSDVRQRLISIATAVADQQSPAHFSLMGGSRDSTGAATELAWALGALDDHATAHRLLTLLAGDKDRRRWAARIAGRRGSSEDVGLLVSLLLDPHPAVRGAAAAQLADIVATERGNSLAIDGLRFCLRDPGVVVPASIAATLEHLSTQNEHTNEVLIELSSHPSAQVRGSAVRALERSHAGEEL
ncbi:hypothetical protein BKA00_004317 [Actinomadura coerulea]|uniref:HEAT repeat domain-containing protein n=1 Tax=Actinomadura coerulea TaxID=46159 RepID=A0A7X0G107_9ACTN|nr:hypothetical protein [Actinomadura coerulea]